MRVVVATGRMPLVESPARNPQSGAQVVLWRELAGQSSFQKMSQTTTDSSGHYTFTLGRGTVMADQALRLAREIDALERIQPRIDAWLRVAAGAFSTEPGHEPFGEGPS